MSSSNGNNSHAPRGAATPPANSLDRLPATYNQPMAAKDVPLLEDVFYLDDGPVILEIANVGRLRMLSDEWPDCQVSVIATDLDREYFFDMSWNTIQDLVDERHTWMWIQTTQGKYYALNDTISLERPSLNAWVASAIAGDWSPRPVEFRRGAHYELEARS